MKYILSSVVVGCATALILSPAFASRAFAQPTTPAPSAAQAPAGQSAQQNFLRAATEGGLDEVTLGRLAAHKSDNSDIQAFGRRMVRDHTRLNNEIGPIAERLGVTPPQKLNAEDQAEYDKLGLLPTADFNKAYMRLMVHAHRKDLQAFRQEAEVAADPQLKRAVEQASVVIATHLRIATRLTSQLGISMNAPAYGTA